MLHGLFMAHSGWRYLVVLAGVIVLARMLRSRLAGAAWTDGDRKLLLATTIVVDLQAFLGLLLWLLERRWAVADPARSWEHPVVMLLALWLMHLGAARGKRASAAGADGWQAAGNWLLGAAVLVALGIARVTLLAPS